MRAKILIVDDDRDILLSLENRVTWMGHEPLTATNGKDALRLIQDEEPDLVLLDLELPVLSGLDVLKQVSETSARPDSPEDDAAQSSSTYTTPPHRHAHRPRDHRTRGTSHATRRLRLCPETVYLRSFNCRDQEGPGHRHPAAPCRHASEGGR
ncbi:MAG: response regulator [Nitrospiraceae bacterium]|nr:response regulator [Nitrospiraceae bacterium]